MWKESPEEHLIKKANLNFAIDAVAFAAFVLLTSTGILVRYVLPPGSGHFSVLWGMDRHEWGQLHFWIAVVLMVTLGLHLFFHWTWVVCMVTGRPREGSGTRLGLSVVGVIALLALASVPFLGRVEKIGNSPHRMRVTDSGQSGVYDIDGSMTLGGIEQRMGISAAVIARELGLPENLSTDEPLGGLSKKHGFEVRDVREVVRREVERK